MTDEDPRLIRECPTLISGAVVDEALNQLVARHFANVQDLHLAARVRRGPSAVYVALILNDTQDHVVIELFARDIRGADPNAALGVLWDAADVVLSGESWPPTPRSTLTLRFSPLRVRGHTVEARREHTRPDLDALADALLRGGLDVN